MKNETHLPLFVRITMSAKDKLSLMAKKYNLSRARLVDIAIKRMSKAKNIFK